MPSDAVNRVSSADLHRPFGQASPTQSGLACRLVAELGGAFSGNLRWTHYLELPAGTDIRDGCTRSGNEIAYADGDEVRLDGARFAVVWVETRNAGSTYERVRAYLMRHT